MTFQYLGHNPELVAPTPRNEGTGQCEDQRGEPVCSGVAGEQKLAALEET